ncbi:MAG: AraC family transcriptional regulator [Acetobacter sp.]|nr:AraC family transcriptional regulator [Bacteroides sp.]MCM1340643.1 AraC family transcriptional regulator [Acetobacter sp.]MCM1433754.1 AraC family transcriptional regulator [Clostridiales bacterium]
MDALAYCCMFYASHYIPVSYYDDKGCILSYGYAKDLTEHNAINQLLMKEKEKPAVIIGQDMGTYAIIEVKENKDHIIIGPTFSSNVTDTSVRTYMTMNYIPSDRFQTVAEFLRSIPQYSYNQLLNLVISIHYIINEEILTLYDYTPFYQNEYEKNIAIKQTNTSYNAREEQSAHGTYLFEQQLLEYVKAGNPAAMEEFLLIVAQETPLIEGKLADDELRQAKNLLNGAVTIVGKYGAIPGGMDVEQAYQLIDIYIQECEHLQDINEIKKLQFNMLMDFTRRVESAQYSNELSNDVFTCIQFINSHINEPIGIMDVVNSTNKSRAYITKKFKEEIGENIGEYITNCKMKEAKNLLKHTDKSLSEISNYLCFSSQAYFQNVFKKQFGITPAKYRQI